jgi:AraC family transcriptional regulator, regulatory protein of adaptative response / methylated-DNA-[protein]-cysteine methyltransferase
MWNENTSYLHGGNDYFQYISAKCSLGFVLTAVSPNGICSILFGNTREELDKAIRSEFRDRDPTYGGYELEGIGAQTVKAVETPRAHISVPLHLVGTAAQVRVWQALRSVPAGDIITYEQIAQRLGAPHTPETVSFACLANKIAVAVPCHRAVISRGDIGEYRWGVERKRALIERELRLPVEL